MSFLPRPAFIYSYKEISKNLLHFRSMCTIIVMIIFRIMNFGVYKATGGNISVIRVDRKELTRCEIVRVAANCFLNDGYTKTTVNSMCKKLNIQTVTKPDEFYASSGFMLIEQEGKFFQNLLQFRSMCTLIVMMIFRIMNFWRIQDDRR